MQHFETRLLREKFLIIDPAKRDEGYEPIKALSNRIEINLPNDKGVKEILTIRAQNMHSCVRYAAQILQSFEQGGALIGRINDKFWQDKWDKIESSYERNFNPRRWLAVYYDGICAFEINDHHPFLDMIERCYADSGTPYEDIVPKAEQAFQKAGKTIHIEQDSNFALTAKTESNTAKLGIILRNPSRSSTFSVKITANKGLKHINPAHTLNLAAAYLEGVELAFFAGMSTEKINIGLVAESSDLARQATQAKSRLSVLSGEIAFIEDTYGVNYRPDKPEFHAIIAEAEYLARLVLASPEDAEFKALQAAQKTTPRSKSAKNDA